MGILDQLIGVAIARDDRHAVLLIDLEDGFRRLARQGEGEETDELIRAGQSRIVEIGGRRLFADVFGPPPTERLTRMRRKDNPPAQPASVHPLWI